MMNAVHAASPTHRRRLSAPLFGALLAAGLASATVPTLAQDDDAIIRRCESELEYRIGREAGGRRPDVEVDYRRARVRRESGSRLSVSGVGVYRRDSGDRGRAYSFDCDVSTRNGDVSVTYRWTDGRDDDRPGFGRPGFGQPGNDPIQTQAPFFSGAIINQNSGKCLDVEDRSLRDGANIQQWNCSSGANQRWDIIERGRGAYAIISAGSGKAMEVADNSNQDGGRVQQNRETRRDHQLWRLERAGNDRYRIVSVGSGKCLDVFDASRADGAKLQIWSCSGGQNQSWVLRR